MQPNRKKRILLVIIAVVAIALIIALGCRMYHTSSDNSTSSASSNTSADVATTTIPEDDEPSNAALDDDESVTFDIKIVTTNDIHAYIEEDADSSCIGLDRVAGIIQDARENSDITLALDGGDTFHGQAMASLVQGESVARAMALVGYDATTAGNHDWNYGKDRLKELDDIAGIPNLTGNIVDENGEKFLGDDSLTATVHKDGKTLTIGVFGVMDPEVFQRTMPATVEGLTALDNITYAQQMADTLRDEGCDIVIALTHALEPAATAAQINGVDLWICGHEHIYIDESVTTPEGGVAYLTESGYHLQSVGLIDMQYEISADGAAAITSYDKTTIEYDSAQQFEKVPAVTAVLEEYDAKTAEIMDQEIGSTTVALDGEWQDVRVDQTNLGNVITDAYLDLTGADIAFEHAGQIRTSIEPGTITYGDAIAISPFGNHVVIKRITGKDVLDCLETSMEIQIDSRKAQAKHNEEAWPAGCGKFLQIGGMKVVYDTTKEKGSRVISVEIGGEPLDESREYTLATNSYVAQTETYPAIARAEILQEYPSCAEAISRYVQQGPEKIAASAADVRYVEMTE